MVATQAKRTGKESLSLYERNINYRDLDEQSNRVAGGLLKLGFGKATVCLLMDNSPEFYYTYFELTNRAIAGPVNCCGDR